MPIGKNAMLRCLIIDQVISERHYYKPTMKRIIEVCKEQGIDVWRDETGSSLVGPMSDSTDETMALAVEASSVVVICVSQKCQSHVSSPASPAPYLRV